MAAIYRFHPSFAHAEFEVWWGNPEQNYRSATLEGGDVLPIGNGNVLIGMSERTSRQAITQLAAALFAKNAAKRVIIAGMPKLRAAMQGILPGPDDIVRRRLTAESHTRIPVSLSRREEPSKSGQLLDHSG